MSIYRIIYDPRLGKTVPDAEIREFAEQTIEAINKPNSGHVSFNNLIGSADVIDECRLVLFEMWDADKIKLSDWEIQDRSTHNYRVVEMNSWGGMADFDRESTIHHGVRRSTQVIRIAARKRRAEIAVNKEKMS